MAGLGLGQLLWGVLSDRFGRRPILLAGLGLYVAAALLCSLSGSFHGLLALRSAEHDTMERVASELGPAVAPLPRALLGARKPLRAFIGHV